MIESPRHDLDEVIDRVAAKMVAIDGDGGVMARVMAQLPERAATPWFMSMRVQLPAAAAVVMVAFLYPRTSPEPATREVSHVAAIAPVETPIPDPGSRIPVARLVETRTPEPGPRIPSVTLGPDHEFSLAPVDAIEALELNGIAPPAMELDAAPSLEPLVLTELALGNQGDR